MEANVRYEGPKTLVRCSLQPYLCQIGLASVIAGSALRMVESAEAKFHEFSYLLYSSVESRISVRKRLPRTFLDDLSMGRLYVPKVPFLTLQPWLANNGLGSASTRGLRGCLREASQLDKFVQRPSTSNR